MPLNLLKTYSGLLELDHLDEHKRKQSLLGIFRRDIEDNTGFSFRNKYIYPIKKEGQIPMQVLFTHLTCEEVIIENEDGKPYPKRQFEPARSKRLHWIRFHIEESKPDYIEVFSTLERDQKKRADVLKTYIYDKTQEYVIVLAPQRSGTDYYLLTAYHLNKEYGKKELLKKMKNKLPEVL
jgi:hypothetical protein